MPEKNIKKELEDCREKLEMYKNLVDITEKCQISIQDIPFKNTDKLLAKKYSDSDEPLLEKKLYDFLHFDRKLQEEGILTNNSIEINLPPINDINELKDFWKSKSSEQRKEIIREYLKLISFSHHFKIKQLVGSLFPLINNRRLLSTILICRTLFEHVAVLNAYYELYNTIVKNKGNAPSFQSFKNGKIQKGDLSESFKKPFEELKNKYKDVKDLNELIFCSLVQRYLVAGRVDIRLYEKHQKNWIEVFDKNDKLEFEHSEKNLELPSVTLDVTFLENKIKHAKKWYSIICEFVHPNSGSHRTVIFEKNYAVKKNGEIIKLPAFENLKFKEKIPLTLNYKLCSISSYDIKQNYAFIIEASYNPLIELITLSIKIIDSLTKDI